MTDYMRDPNSLNATIDDDLLIGADWRNVGYIKEREVEHPWAYTAWPVRFIAGMDLSGVDLDSIKPGILWQDPAPVTIEMRHIRAEVLEIFFGRPLVPLCERRLPPEGIE